jgi:hypothetical protein
MFGPSVDELWHRLSCEVNGTFFESTSQGFCKVEVGHENWIITLDRYTVATLRDKIPYTRMRAPFVNCSGFTLNVYRRTSFDDLEKSFGMQDLEIGDTHFDDAFIIRSNDEEKVRCLLTEEIRQVLMEQIEGDFGLCIRDSEEWLGPKFPEGVNELYLLTLGTITDNTRLKQLFELFAATLNRLYEIGAASSEPANVKL